jgi:hypothetical protein
VTWLPPAGRHDQRHLQGAPDLPSAFESSLCMQLFFRTAEATKPNSLQTVPYSACLPNHPSSLTAYPAISRIERGSTGSHWDGACSGLSASLCPGVGLLDPPLLGWPHLVGVSLILMPVSSAIKRPLSLYKSYFITMSHACSRCNGLGSQLQPGV